MRTLLAGLFLCTCLGAAPAMADQIVGQWCPPGGGRSMNVQNYDDVRFNGAQVKANVDRHHVDFTIPAGEPDAGQTFTADQLNDDEIRVTIGTSEPVIWNPCKPVS